MSLTRHTSYNLLGAALPIIVSLITVPVYLHLIGEARFGILAIAWLLLGFFGQFDLGLGMATSHHIAAANDGSGSGAMDQADDDQRKERVQLFWSALIANASLGSAGGLILWPVAQYYFGHVMLVEPAIRSEILAALPWLILAVPLATTTGVLAGTLQGLSRFGRLNVISAAGTVLFQILPLAAVMLWSPKLTILLPVSIIARGLTLLALSVEVRRVLLRASRISFSRARTVMLLKYGGWVTISALFVPLLVMIDRFAIGAFLGAVAVSHFTVPFNLGDRLMILGNSLGSALFPKLSKLTGDDLRAICVRSEHVLMSAMLVVCVTATFAMAPFLRLWISPQFAASAAPAAQILMIGVWFDSVSRVALYGLRGQARPQAVAKVDLVQTLPYWIVLYFALTYAGLIGAAWAYVFRVSLNYILLGRENGTLRNTLRTAICCAAIMGLSLVMVQSCAPWTMGWMVGFAACLVIASAFAFRCCPADLQQSVLSRLRWLYPWAKIR